MCRFCKQKEGSSLKGYVWKQIEAPNHALCIIVYKELPYFIMQL